MLEVIRWAAAGGAMVAALVVAARFTPKITGYGFVLFTVSSVLWIVAGYLDGLNSLIAQNAILTGVNLFGVYRWLIVHD